MKIFSVALGPHDHNVYDGVFHNQIERYSRIKHNFDGTAKFYDEYFKPDDHEVLAFTVTIGGMESIPHHKIKQEFLDWKPKHLCRLLL